MSEHPFAQFGKAREVSFEFFDRQYEDQQVSYVLRRFKLTDRATVADLRRQSMDETGTGALTFKAFNEQFHSFPLLLAASRLRGVKLHLEPTALLPAWFKDFTGTPFALEYAEWYRRAAPRAEGRSIGLVFPRKGIRGGLVIHDEMSDYRRFRGFTGVYVGDEKLLFVRPFQTLIDTVWANGHGWRPGG